MLNINEDERGKIVSLNDLVSNIPFVVKRFMEIAVVPDGQTRGYHAHQENDQFLLCFNGRVIVRTIRKDESGALIEQSHELKEGDFLYMPSMTWGEQTYYDNAVLHVLCSKKYDEEDYIRDYEQFKEL